MKLLYSIASGVILILIVLYACRSKGKEKYQIFIEWKFGDSLHTRRGLARENGVRTGYNQWTFVDTNSIGRLDTMTVEMFYE